MNRRFFARIMTGIGLLLWIPTAWTQSVSFPNRPIHVIVPFPPGGAVDPIARSITPKLEEAWGQPVVVDNKPGASTIIGSDFVAKAAPDGHTVVLVATSFTVNPSAYSKLPFDPVKDFAPISLVSRLPNMLVVNAQLPVYSVKELVDYLKARPGKVNFSSIGYGSTQHLAGELFKSVAGVDMVHVPYKGSGPSMMSVVSGETSVTFDSVFLLTPQVKAGKLRALAAAGMKRASLAPNIPTASESGLPDYEVEGWVGFLAPAGTPREIIQKWHQEITRIFQTPEFRERQISQGLEPVGSTPEYFAEFIKTEISKWGKVVKQAGIKLD